MEVRFKELESMLADQKIISDQSQYQKLAKEYSDLTEIVNIFSEYKNITNQIDDLKTLLNEKQDHEFEALAKSDLKECLEKQTRLEQELDDLVNPKKQPSNRAVIIEIRAGTGGGEASLFAADLYRMYTRYAEKKGWKIESIDSHGSEGGGFKEVIFSVSGIGAEQHLKWESGAHRVQRVPTTEASGRIHTSAATVAVLMEAEDIDLVIDPNHLKIDIYRSSGPGGQSVNTTDSAVRITHLPTGTIVVCQDERSQQKNKAKAMRVLRARILDKMQSDSQAAESKDRKLKVGSGDRSEKIRTYNYPDRRVTDHRIGFTSHKLQFIMDGDLDEIAHALINAENEDLINERT